jgi:hypothetical protein
MCMMGDGTGATGKHRSKLVLSDVFSFFLVCRHALCCLGLFYVGLFSVRTSLFFFLKQARTALRAGGKQMPLPASLVSLVNRRSSRYLLGLQNFKPAAPCSICALSNESSFLPSKKISAWADWEASQASSLVGLVNRRLGC